MQRDLQLFASGKTPGLVERDSGQRGREFDSLEPGFARGRFARVQEKAAQTLPGIVRVDEESPDTRGIASGIEEGIVFARRMIAAEWRPAPAPSTARDDPAVHLDDEVGAVADHLPVDAEHGTESAGALAGVVVGGLQPVDGFGYERLYRGRVFEGGGADHPPILSRRQMRH